MTFRYWQHLRKRFWGLSTKFTLPQNTSGSRKCDSKRSLAKGELGNDVLANLIYLPYWKCSTFFQDGKGYTYPINWLWEGRSISLWQYKIPLANLFSCSAEQATVESCMGAPLFTIVTPTRLQKPVSYFLTLPSVPATVQCPVQHALLVISQGVVVDCADSSTLSPRFLGWSASLTGNPLRQKSKKS